MHNDGFSADSRLQPGALADYAYLVPYVETKDEVFLKTVIPSRKFTKLNLRGDS